MLALDGHITDDGLAHLKGLVNLEHLHFDATDIGGAGLAHIQSLPRLVNLYLHSSEISDVALGQLKAFKNLKNLWLNNADVTERAMSDLQQALPVCQIVHSPRSGPQGTWVPVAIERDGAWREATEKEKQQSRPVLKRDKLEFGVGEERVNGTFLLDLDKMHMSSDGNMRMAIDLTVLAAPGVMVSKEDRPQLLGILEYAIDHHTLRLCLDPQERPKEFKFGKGRHAIEYRRVHP